jgi:phospholipid/cholesterol/gamma-HCH transport system permease protein
MKPKPVQAAELSQPTAQDLVLSGFWTAGGIGPIEHQLESIRLTSRTNVIADATRIEALDTAGAWVLYKLLTRLRGSDVIVTVRGLPPRFAKLLDLVAQHIADAAGKPLSTRVPPPTALERIGRGAESAFSQSLALLAFIGESAYALAGCFRHPARFRWRTVLYNIRTAGVDALPIVGLLSFMLGIVVAYQGADQLRQYGANIFVADLVGLSMLREFAPLITAIIIAGRSGSAYAAQIGTMEVTEEIDAMRTLGIAPLEQLVLPKIIALVIALPLLTVFADFLGVFGGMLMARAQLGVGFGEFVDRFVKAVSITAYMVGIGKAPVFAGIIAAVGCFQGFRTRGGADSVGRQTTRAVVQSIFLVILTDGLFSVAFSALDL